MKNQQLPSNESQTTSEEKNIGDGTLEFQTDEQKNHHVSVLPRNAFGSLTSMSNIDPYSAQDKNSVEGGDPLPDLPYQDNIFIDNQEKNHGHKTSKALSYEQLDQLSSVQHLTFDGRIGEDQNIISIQQRIRQNVATKP